MSDGVSVVESAVRLAKLAILPAALLAV